MPDYRHARPRGFARWSPNAASLDIITQVLDILDREAAYLPLTARQVFYRMVAHHGFEKTEKAYARLCDKISRGRRAGMVPWDAIRDDGESARYNQGFGGVDGFKRWVSRYASNFELNPAQVQACRVEVHVEAAGMMPQVARVACPLGATVYSSGGFGSSTAQYEAAKRMANRGCPTVVLSIGDFDPSGISLYWAFRENVLAFYSEGIEDGQFEESGTDSLMWPPLFRRIAVTPEQIREHGFITAPPKKTDRRGDWDGNTVQCEAIPSQLLDEIVEEAILEHYDFDLIDEVRNLAVTARGPLAAAFGAVDVATLGTVVRDGLGRLREDPDPYDDTWKAGHDNDDELDMEEGIR